MAQPVRKTSNAAAAAKADLHAVPPEAGENERARVLVVDDDERNLLAIQTVLEDVADIVTASSGEEALRHLLKGEFAVILLDVYMPGMDGYERSEEHTSELQSLMRISYAVFCLKKKKKKYKT